MSEEHILSRLDYIEVESTDDRLVLEMDNRPDLANVRGALQGGLVATLIDISAGILAGRHSGAGNDVTTADLNIHFLAPIMGRARAEARRPSCGPASGSSSPPSTSPIWTGAGWRHGQRSPLPYSNRDVDPGFNPRL